MCLPGFSGPPYLVLCRISPGQLIEDTRATNLVLSQAAIEPGHRQSDCRNPQRGDDAAIEPRAPGSCRAHRSCSYGGDCRGRHFRALTGGLGQTSIPDTVFVHGYGGAPDHWDAVRRELPPELRGSAVTLPGHAGRASELAEFSIEAAAHDIAQQVPERPVVLVGHSMGARIAMEIAVRSQAQVAALILIDGSCVPADPTVASDMIARALSSRGKAALAEELIEDALPGRLPSEARKALTIAMAKMSDDAMIQYTGPRCREPSHEPARRVRAASQGHSPDPARPKATSPAIPRWPLRNPIRDRQKDCLRQSRRNAAGRGPG